MLRPEFLEQLPEAMVELYSQVEQDILADMARRIATYDYWIPAAEHQHKVMAEMGAVHSHMMKALSSQTGKSLNELERLMGEAGQKALDFDMGVYQEHGLSPPSLAASKELQSVLRAGLKQTNGLFKNLTRTTANTASKQFENALDRAWLQISSGAFDSGAAIRMAVKDLARQGVGSVSYPSGHVGSIEVAVRRATVTGVNQTALKLQEAIADEMGSDLVEVTAHAGARPDHALWQGGVYSRSGKSKKYKGLREATGYGTGSGLGGWNCRHSFFPYFEGSPRAYTPEMLKRFETKDYTYRGQAMTEYEAVQQQRYIERQIRRWKRENAAMKAASLDTAESAVKVKQWQATQKDFLTQTGLKRQYNRERVETATISPKRLPDTKHTAGFRVGHSVGAKSKNYEIVDRASGRIYHLVEGSHMQNVEVFAGKGVKTPLRPEVAEGLADEFGGKPEDWQHVKGFCVLDTEDGERNAEVHWFQAKQAGKIKFLLKRWLDDEG